MIFRRKSVDRRRDQIGKARIQVPAPNIPATGPGCRMPHRSLNWFSDRYRSLRRHTRTRDTPVRHTAAHSGKRKRSLCNVAPSPYCPQTLGTALFTNQSRITRISSCASHRSSRSDTRLPMINFVSRSFADSKRYFRFTHANIFAIAFFVFSDSSLQYVSESCKTASEDSIFTKISSQNSRSIFLLRNCANNFPIPFF